MFSLFVCIDRFLVGADANLRAFLHALRERPKNRGAASHLHRLALAEHRHWAAGRILRVRFFTGTRTVHAQVLATARRWTLHANLAFKDVTEKPAEPAEIRVSFGAKGDRSAWSYIGTDCLEIAASEPTMHLGDLEIGNGLSDLQRVVLHEFGHALGFIHEHQSPAAAIPWNLPEVYRYYAAPPSYWNAQQVLHNIVGRYRGTVTQYSNFDPHSIMLYPIAKELTDGMFEIAPNYELSATDRAFARNIYPYGACP